MKHHHFFSHNTILVWLIGGLLLFAVSQMTPGAAMARTAKEAVIFLPFDITPEAKDMQYLAKGLTTMLASRVASRSDTLALYQNRMTSQLSQHIRQGHYKAVTDLLQRSRASYLIISSLDRDRSHYVLTSYVFSKKQPSPHILTRPVDSPEQIIPALDRFAWDIVSTVFGKPAPVATPSSPGGRQQGMKAFQTAHPERAFRLGLYSGQGVGLESGGASLLAAYRSRKIPFSVQAMDAGDLDGDDRIESILASNTELLIYRFQEEQFSRVATIPLGVGYLRVHAINLADLDGNGQPEIYISASNGDTPASMVLTWEKGTAHFLSRDIPFYLRPGRLPDGKGVLLGQPPGITGPLGDSVYQLVPDSAGGYLKHNKIPVPAGLNIFDFIRTDLDGDGLAETVAIDRNNRLQVFDKNGEKIWQSTIAYGASRRYYGTLSSTRDANRRTYIPTRLIATDLDGDGKAEIVVGRNRLSTFPYFNRIRYFEGSSIVTLAWRDNQLTPVWETRKLAGYTADYQVIPVGTQGKNIALFFAETESSSPFFFWESDACLLHLLQIGKQGVSPAPEH